MAEPRVSNLIRVVADWNTAFGPAVNVMHVEDPGVGTTLQTIADSFLTGLRNFMYDTPTGGTAPPRNYIHTGCSLTSVTVTDWSVLNGAQAVSVPDPVIAGAGTQPEPGQISIVMSWRTGFAGRSKRGRTYLPGIATAALTAGRINGTARSNIELAAQEFIDYLDVATWPLVIYSRVPPGSFTQVQSVIVDDRFDTQRSRAQ